MLESALTPPLPINQPFENGVQFYFRGCSFLPSLRGIPPFSPPLLPHSFPWICSLLLPGCQKTNATLFFCKTDMACALPCPTVYPSPLKCYRINSLLCGSCPRRGFPSLTPSFQLHFPFLCFKHKCIHIIPTHTAHAQTYMHTHTHVYIASVQSYTPAHIYSDTYTLQT